MGCRSRSRRRHLLLSRGEGGAPIIWVASMTFEQFQEGKGNTVPVHWTALLCYGVEEGERYMRLLSGLTVFLLLAVGGPVKAAHVDVILYCGGCVGYPDPAILDVGDTLTFTCAPEPTCAPQWCCVYSNTGINVTGITPFTQCMIPGETGAVLGPATVGGEHAVVRALNDACFPSFDIVLETTPEVSVVCGDGVIAVSEECDDGGTTPGDGCDASCQIEAGWSCAGEPSQCDLCGDGGIGGAEQCDDGGTTPGDGCDASCQIEPYWTCVGEPSVCSAIPTPALPKWGYVALAAGLIGVGAVVMRRRVA